MASPHPIPDPAREARRERARERRARDFLAAAEAVFAEKGYHEAGIDEIAARAGYAAGSIYRYFPSKKDLYQTLLADKAGESLQRARAVATEDGPALDRLRAVVRSELEFIRTNERFLRVLVAEVMSGRDDHTEECQRHRQSYLDLLRKLLREGIRRGEFRPHDGDLTAILIGRLGETLFHEYLGPDISPRLFKQRLARIESFLIESIDRLLLPP